jgi:hypothetical protein
MYTGLVGVRLCLSVFGERTPSWRRLSENGKAPTLTSTYHHSQTSDTTSDEHSDWILYLQDIVKQTSRYVAVVLSTLRIVYFHRYDPGLRHQPPPCLQHEV